MKTHTRKYFALVSKTLLYTDIAFSFLNELKNIRFVKKKEKKCILT